MLNTTGLLWEQMPTFPNIPSLNREMSLRHVAMVAKFLDLNKPWSPTSYPGQFALSELKEEAWNRVRWREFSRQAWQVTSHPKSPRTTGNEAAWFSKYGRKNEKLEMTFLCMIALRNKTVAHTFLPLFNNTNDRLCKERFRTSPFYSTRSIHTFLFVLRIKHITHRNRRHTTRQCGRIL